MRWIVAVAVVVGVGFGVNQSTADAAQCRDTAGKFIKCPKVVHCRNDAGKFVKCGIPGAKPA